MKPEGGQHTIITSTPADDAVATVGPVPEDVLYLKFETLMNSWESSNESFDCYPDHKQAIIDWMVNELPGPATYTSDDVAVRALSREFFNRFVRNLRITNKLPRRPSLVWVNGRAVGPMAGAEWNHSEARRVAAEILKYEAYACGGVSAWPGPPPPFLVSEFNLHLAHICPDYRVKQGCGCYALMRYVIHCADDLGCIPIIFPEEYWPYMDIHESPEE